MRPSVQQPISKDKNVIARTRKYYLKNNYLTLRSKVKVPWRHYGTRHTALWSCTHIPNKYYLRNNYLTLRSKVKVPRTSLRYLTHRLMVMHPHTKYHWPISKDKNIMALTRKYIYKTIIWPWGQRSRPPRTSLWYATHCLMVMYPHTK
jgi:hypothetical protein